MFNVYLRPHLNTLTPALCHAPKDTINKFITRALDALKAAINIPKTSSIKVNVINVKLVTSLGVYLCHSQKIEKGAEKTEI